MNAMIQSILVAAIALTAVLLLWLIRAVGRA